MSQPLAEVFGYRIDDLTDRAKRYRSLLHLRTIFTKHYLS